MFVCIRNVDNSSFGLDFFCFIHIPGTSRGQVFRSFPLSGEPWGPGSGSVHRSSSPNTSRLTVSKRSSATLGNDADRPAFTRLHVGRPDKFHSAYECNHNGSGPAASTRSTHRVNRFCGHSSRCLRIASLSLNDDGINRCPPVRSAAIS